MITRVDRCGGVFAPVPGKLLRPAYSYGMPTKGGTRDVMFQCPASAIPAEVWDLLLVWWQSRQMGLPVRAGGWEDQPGIVRYAFPLFEAEMKAVESRKGGPEAAAAMAVAATLKAVMGR